MVIRGVERRGEGAAGLMFMRIFRDRETKDYEDWMVDDYDYD